MSILDQKIGEYYPNQQETICFEYEDYYSYRYPYEDEVPEAWYYSLITDVRRPPDCGYKPCIDVYYKIVRTDVVRAYLDDYIGADKVKYYYIRQRYVVHSVHYRDFCCAIYQALNKKKFDSTEVIGVTEAFHLVYERDGVIGSIRSRCAKKVHESFFHLDEEDFDEEADEE